jgi:TolB-like protein
MVDSPDEADALDPALVRAALERVLASPAFAGAGRLSRFLRFTVEQALEGRADRVKEYVLGVEVFDRSDGFDPRLDSIVRVEARRLRAKLTEYYAQDGAADPLVIQLPKGAYVPTFEPRPLAPAASSTAAHIADDVAPASGGAPRAARRSSSGRLMAAALALVVIVAVGLGWTWRSRPQRPPAAVAIAVLPLVNYSGDPRQDTLAARLTDGIISELAREPTLAVRSRTSVLQYRDARLPLREIARALDVEVLIEGGVVADGGSVQVNARLVSAASDRKFWAETFVGRQNDVRALEQRIARAAAAALIARQQVRPAP